MEQKIHASDCAVHNAPALPAGPCDCGAKQDERTPGPWRIDADNRMLVKSPFSTIVARCQFANGEVNAAFIVQACNAYTSTEALREALAEWTPELENHRVDLCKFLVAAADELERRTFIDENCREELRLKLIEAEAAFTIMGDILARATLFGSPAPANGD